MTVKLSGEFPLLCVLFAFFCAAVGAATNTAPPPAVDCTSLVLNLADCLSYVTVGGTADKPEGTCCSGLKTVLKTDANCLCIGFRNSAQLGVTLNMTKALALPSACHVSAPPVSNCALSPSSGVAPALSPMAASPTTVPGAPTASGPGAAEVPPATTPAASRSSATCALATSMLVFTMLAAVSFALF